MNNDDAASQPRVRCRQIGEADIEAVVGLLLQGFAGRTRRYWLNGFERQAKRVLPADVPRYGFMLESDAVPVGVILLFYASFESRGESRIRCNLSSWYVDPEFRSHASLLIFFALKHKHVTYFNISPDPQTWATIEAQGFRRYASGQFLSIPALNGTVAGCRLHQVRSNLVAGRFASMPERNLLVEHAGMGCLSLVAEASDGLHPFVFMSDHIRLGLVSLPIRQLIYCRDIADYVRFAGPIGRLLLRRGILVVAHDGSGPESGLVGHFGKSLSPKYFRGPEAPRQGDLAYTEWALFGP